MKTLNLDVKLLENQEDLRKLNKGDIAFLYLHDVVSSCPYEGLGLYIGNIYIDDEVNLEFIPLHIINKRLQDLGSISSYPIKENKIILKSGAIVYKDMVVRELTLKRNERFDGKFELINKIYEAK
jgi:hypothetical protein